MIGSISCSIVYKDVLFIHALEDILEGSKVDNGIHVDNSGFADSILLLAEDALILLYMSDQITYLLAPFGLKTESYKIQNYPARLEFHTLRMR